MRDTSYDTVTGFVIDKVTLGDGVVHYELKKAHHNGQREPIKNFARLELAEQHVRKLLCSREVSREEVRFISAHELVKGSLSQSRALTVVREQE